MADPRYVTTLLGGIQDPTTKGVLNTVFTYVLNNLRHGAVNASAPRRGVVNFGAYFVSGTTPSSTGEFVVAHGMDMAPKLAQPVLDLTAAGSRLVPLEATRSADGKFLYLKTSAGFTSAPFVLMVE